MTLSIDRFGVAKYHYTSDYGFNTYNHKGWEYYANKLSFGEVSTFQGVFGKLDNYLHFINSVEPFPTFTIQGDNRLTIIDIPHLSYTNLGIYDDDNLTAGINNCLSTMRGKRWGSNVEFTFYFKIKYRSIFKPLDGGIYISLPNDKHFNENISCPYNARDYSLMIENNGKMYLTGTSFLGATLRTPKPDNNINVDYWDTDFQGIPLDTDIGIKLIKRVINNGKQVLIEVYRDLTNAKNGGEWVKLFEFNHEIGNWYDSSLESFYNISINSTKCIIKPKTIDNIQIGGGGQVNIKLSNIKEIELKYISCRDINHNITNINTTDQELTDSGDSGIYDTIW